MDSNNRRMTNLQFLSKHFSDYTVGHILIELLQIFWEFLSIHGGIEAECIVHKYNVGRGNGLELPVDYRFFGNQKYLKQVHRRLRKLDGMTANDRNIHKIKESETVILGSIL